MYGTGLETRIVSHRAHIRETSSGIGALLVLVAVAMQVLPAWNAVDVAVAGARSRFDIRVDLSGGIVSWDPQGLGQTAYQADVEVEHWLACEFVGQIYKTEKIEFNEVRPHSALGYRPPAPQAIVPRPGSTAPFLETTAMATLT